MKTKSIIFFTTVLILSSLVYFYVNTKIQITNNYKFGDAVDSLNGVKVFYNGDVANVKGRNRSEDGYNLGLKYQCVEFVKRYYYQHFKHKMPNSYGHAKDFFDTKIKDGELNKNRDLNQFSNPSKSKPKVNDLLIFDGTSGNPFGHVAIISQVWDNEIEIIQQNPGPNSKSRVKYDLDFDNQLWEIDNSRILGWLRMK